MKKSHIEKSKKYELDKFLIKKIYNIQDKKKRVYNLSKKNVVYDKQLTDQYFKYSNNNRSNYYCSYQSFRDYITSGYNYDFLVNEINNIKSILGFSHSIREIINKKLNPEISIHNNSSSISNQNQIIELNEESNSNDKINFQNEENENPFQNIPKNTFNKQKNNETINRRASTVFQIDKDNPYIKRVADFAHKNIQLGGTYQANIKKATGKRDFLEICKLLKIKEEEAKNPQNQYQFRLFSELTEEFDPFYLPVYENFVSIKYENQKTKLNKLYIQENAFIECVTSIKSKLKFHLNRDKKNNNGIGNNPSTNANIMKQNISFNNNFPQHRFQIKIPYTNAFYFGRTESFFKNIDNFMSMYKENISLSSKKLEKDFFENLFKILTFNNTDCKKFLQYLFTHSYFFKYIYNIFTIQKGIGKRIKYFAPFIKKNVEKDPFLNDAMRQLFFQDDGKNISTEEIQLSKEDNISKPAKDDEVDLDELMGNEFIYKINICEEDISDYINNKKISDLKKILSNNQSFSQNYILTLNNNENLIQIINMKNSIQKLNNKKKGNLKYKKYLLSVPFDEKVHFYDLEKDIKNLNLEKERNKSEKYILIGIKRKNENFTQVYLFKINKDIYTRFTKLISSKGNKIKKKELFSEAKEEEKSDSQVNMEDVINEANIDKEQKDSGNEEIFGFGSNENDSEINEHKKKEEKNAIDKERMKREIRKNEKKFTFGAGAFFNSKKDNLNESDKNDDDKSDVKQSSDEIKQKSSEEEDEKEENEEDDKEDDSGEGEDDENEGNEDDDESDEIAEKDEKNNIDIENKEKLDIKEEKKEEKDSSDEESEDPNKNHNEEKINKEAKDSDDEGKENEKSNSS